METLAIIFGVITIFIAAYAADQNEKSRSYKSKIIREQGLAAGRYLELEYYKKKIIEATPERLPYEKEVKTWKEYREAAAVSEQKYKDLESAYLRQISCGANQGYKSAEVIKIELSDEFKELKAVADSMATVAILKKELDRAHKREAVYMKRLLANTALINQKLKS